MPASPTMLFSGMVAATPGHGGATWAVLQYLLGFRELGWDVWFVEQAPASHAWWCESVMASVGLHDRWCLLDNDAPAGASRADVLAAGERAELLVNVSGMLTDPAILEAVPVRVYLDLDPTFVQMWHAYDGVDMRFDAHTHFVTLSDRVGVPGGVIPECGREWHPILPPVVLSHWPVSDDVVLSFGTVDDGVRAIERVAADYEHHRNAARALAEQHLDSARVLTGILEAVLT